MRKRAKLCLYVCMCGGVREEEEESKGVKA